MQEIREWTLKIENKKWEFKILVRKDEIKHMLLEYEAIENIWR